MDKSLLSEREIPETVLFVRHIMDASSDMFERWLHEGLAVLHYEDYTKDKMSVDPKDFTKSGRKVMQRLNYYCQRGALVVADYNNYSHKVMLLGILPPNSKIEPRKERVKISKYYPEGFAYYEVVKLVGCVHLPHSHRLAKPLLVLQPRQGTVVNWTIGNIAKYVRFIYTRLSGDPVSMTNLPLEEYPFTDYQLEVLCSEYLRSMAPNDLRIDYLLTPVGRTMKDIDIDGANKESHILAQVSWAKSPDQVKEKVEKLMAYSSQAEKKTKLVYFGPNECREYVESLRKELTYVPIEEVLKRLKTTGIIDDMMP